MTEQPRPLKLLILAFDCHPTLPSLPVVTFKLCQRIAADAEIVVVTHKQDDHIEVPGTETVRISVDHVKNPLDAMANMIRGGNDLGWTTKTAFTYPTYIAFERLVWKRFKKALHAGEFDAVVRLSPMSPVLPSPMAKWSPVPFVIGSVNGGLPYPPTMQNVMVKEREILRPLRALSRHLPYMHSSYRHAAAILAGFQHTIDDLPVAPPETTINYPEIGFDPALFYPAETMPPADPIRFLYVGRLVPYKFPLTVVEAVANSPLLQQHRLEIVGDGPERAEMEALIKTHGLENAITLSGWTDQTGCAEAMRRSHVFVFPSVRELGAGVVIEALACGLPGVVADYGAPGYLVNEQRGFPFPLTTQADMRDAVRTRMEDAVRQADRLPQRRQAALDFSSNFTWERKAQHLLAVCDWVTGRIQDRPDPYPLAPETTGFSSSEGPRPTGPASELSGGTIADTPSLL